MTDELRRQPREVEQALMAPEGVTAVPKEHISLLQRVGSRDKVLASVDALMSQMAPSAVAARLPCRRYRQRAL